MFLSSVHQVQSRIDKFFGSPKRPANADNVKSSKEALGKSVQNLADYFLKDKKFIAGDEISIADLACLCELVQLRGVNETACYESNPKVKAWAKRVEDSLKPHFEESLAIINDIAKQYGAGK